MAEFVDWDLAVTTAAMLGKSGPRVTFDEANEVVVQLRQLAGEAAAHVQEFTRMTPQGSPPPVRVVDRRDWASVNVDGLRQVMAPLISRLASGIRTPGPWAEAVGARLTGGADRHDPGLSVG